MAVPLLDVQGLVKSFGGIIALKDGGFTLEAGSVHALCGGNGAGKSTFLCIVMRIRKADAGEIRRNGRVVRFDDPSEASAAGITIFEQELGRCRR